MITAPMRSRGTRLSRKTAAISNIHEMQVPTMGADSKGFRGNTIHQSTVAARMSTAARAA
jgi:hypothetical protein